MTPEIRHASQQQTLAAQPDHHIHVEANAGSGKTRVLVSRVARLLLAKTPPDKILCLTYTKAAAGEMKSRLFDRLGKWSIADDAALTGELNALHNVEGETYSREELADARRLFARALETPGGLAVQTIHAFCQSLLQRFPLEAGLPPGFEVADDSETRAIAAEARRGLLLSAAADDRLQSALEAIQSRGTDSFDLIVRMAAGQRADFTKVLREKGEDGLRADLRAELGVSGNASAAGLRESGWSEAPHEALKSAALTMQTGKATDQKAAGLILAALAASDKAQALEMISGVYFTQKGELRKSFCTKDIREGFPAIDALLNQEAARLADLRQQIAAAEMAEASEAANTIAADYVRRYEQGLRARRRLDYSDLIAFAVDLLENAGARDWVRYKMDAGIDHVLVDEAQDNAPEQWRVIGALVEEFFAGSGIERGQAKTVFTVGDEKQSIYSFQGAEPKRFLEWGARVRQQALEAAQLFETPPLSVSFRSSNVILEAVDAAFEPERLLGETRAVRHAPETKFAGSETLTASGYSPALEAFERYQTHQAAWTERPGLVEFWPAVPAFAKADHPDPAAPVDRESAMSPPHRLALLVAQEIRRILDDGDAVHDEETRALRPAEPKDIMVLVTRRSGFFRELIRRLKQLGVPVAGADRMVLTEELAVQDLINLAEVALNPLDDLKLAEFLKTPFLDPVAAPAPINEDALYRLAHGRKGALWDALRDSSDPVLAEAKTALMRARARIGTAGVYGFFADFLNERSATGETRQKRLFARLGEEARDPVEEFLARSIAYEQQAMASLPGFIAELKAGEGQIKREMDEGRGEVRVMTVHGSKGLEAPIVILPDTTTKARVRAERRVYFEDRFGIVWAPSGDIQPELSDRLKQNDEIRAEGENARLLYVALTRASDRLLVCGWKRFAAPGRIDERSWYERLDTLWQGEGWESVETPVEDEDGNRLEGRWRGMRPEKMGRAERLRAQIDLPPWALAPALPETGKGRTVAPSHLADEDDTPVLSPLAGDMSHRFRRGSLIHKLLETLPDLPPDRREEAAMAYLSMQADLDTAQRADIAQETLNVLAHSEFAPLFGPGSLAEVSLTGSAPGLPDGLVLNGQVDRLVITDHEILILDYKTNRPPPTDARDVPRLYLAQMAAYQALLRAIHPGKSVRCALLWTDGPRLMELDDAALKSALAAGVKA
ncbi:UvrD-helicase domain-containing protein [Hyphobacterium sp. HN65]|uniref:DNA 3'-5' helicase n=1 Tax=Hyphobacterium lacteum TaxID=3116575 RepID=A0ABU7LSR0_9PROT|nr:UvrD-helicase domain-containing protein [Hyphobacterium sp. HN65]MEE2526939.1 UvrD-helicase domain-containing protein [Hyphobacterium sp. HN65]